ncbi:MAG: fused MFS/spermidine synthase [Thermoguttaceae bacterium]
MSRKRRQANVRPTSHAERGQTETGALAPSRFLCRLFLLTAAFVAGGAVMIIELAGNRILAPWYGNTMYTWTGLIGVILVSISSGYYLGGALADRRPAYTVMAHLLAISAVLTLLIPLVQSALLVTLGGLDVVSGPVVATFALFALPGCLLASVSPFAVRLVSLLSDDRRVGLSAGWVGMAGTWGSVAGTFATGFVFVPHLPLRAIFLITGGLLAVLALWGYVLFWPRTRTDPTLAALLVSAFVLSGILGGLSGEEAPANVIYEENTFYHRVRVEENPYAGGRTRRTLWLDTTIEGGQLVGSRENPADHAYQRYWELARVFAPQLKRGVFLGGGAYAMPEALLDAMPEAVLDVVEVDPAVVEVGRKYFRVDEYAGRLRPVAADARRFLRMTDERYDLVFGDAYAGIKCIPPHLITREFFELVSDRLNPRGIFIINIAAAPTGPDSVVFQSALATIGEVFEHQCVFSSETGHLDWEQNLFVVAAHHDLEIEAVLARSREPSDPAYGLLAGYVPAGLLDRSLARVFTDEENPVEYLVARTLRGG